MERDYRATDEQWKWIEDAAAGYSIASCIAELRARIEVLEAAQQQVPVPPPQKQTELELEEILAQIIYEQAIIPTARHCHAEAPEWVVGGNSIAQDDARATARAIIRRWPRGDQPQPQQDQSQDTPKMVDTGWRRLHDLSPIMEPAPPAHAGGLVRRMSHLLAKQFIESRAGDDCTPFARDVLREVAAWLRDLHPSPGMASAANRLDLEAER